MSPRASLRAVAEIGRGLLISLVVSACALAAIYAALAPFGIALVYFLHPLLTIAGAIIVPIALWATYRAVKDHPFRAIGAVLFYPLAVATYSSYQVYLDLQERRAMQHDYPARAIAQPVGPVRMVGINDGCFDVCRRALLNGLAVDVLGVSFSPPARTHFDRSARDDRVPRIHTGYSLVPVERCVNDNSSLQSIGIFDVCLVSWNVIRDHYDLPDGMILIVTGTEARRPHGPTDAILGFQIKGGRPVEIARWESGSYPRSGKSVGGSKIDPYKFLTVLAGVAPEDRIKAAASRTFDEAVAAVEAFVRSAPKAPISAGAIFHYLTNVHMRERGPNNPRQEPATGLREVAQALCAREPADGPRRTCMRLYEAMLSRVFRANVAEALRL